MPTQAAKAKTFRALHACGRPPLVLFNVWDAGGAKVVAATGARAIATGSWSVAAAHGFEDGERLPLDLAIDNLARIVRVTDLPVTIDLESGYGETAGEVARSVGRAVEAGAVGCNLEDSFSSNGSMRSADQQAERIARARQAARDADIDLFINARTDVFFQKPADAHDESMVQDALDRGRIYANAGADGLFVPGVVDERLIGCLAANSPLPVNIMVQADTPSNRRLAERGVARISYGPQPYLALMKLLDEAARAALPEAESVS
ncbi:MAG TPA: isocitrate lyase/phosphoenolpyruvate mutase family protein [Hyphomonadaceae bacterium]|nr:isocitrate lyase/phosphoenolpyruvate mutase family protein [Hyphomonadaceae bacterium]